MGAGVAPAGVLLLTKKRTFFHKKTNNKMLLRLLSSEKTKKKSQKKISPSPQYFKMMVLLLYIQNQDKQKMTKKNQIKFPEKKYPNPATTQNNPKNPSKTTKNFA